MGGLFSAFSFWSLPPIDFAAFDYIHDDAQQMHSTDPLLASPALSQARRQSAASSSLLGASRDQQDCRGAGGKEEHTDSSDLVAQPELVDHVNPNTYIDASPLPVCTSTTSGPIQQPARQESAQNEEMELATPEVVVELQKEADRAEAEQTTPEPHPALISSSPVPKHNLRIDIPPPPSDLPSGPQDFLPQVQQDPPAEEDAAAAAAASDSTSQSTADLAFDEDSLSALEKIYLYSQSPSSYRRVYIARSLPLFLPQITSCEAVEYVIPLMNSLAVDEDEAVKEALVEKLSSSIWWFLSNCQLTADDESRLTDGDGDPSSSNEPALLPVQSFTPLLGTLLLSSNYDVSASARESVVDLLDRIQEMDAMGQSSTDPGPHERRLFEEEIIFQVVVGVGRLDIDGEGEGLGLGLGLGFGAEEMGLEVDVEGDGAEEEIEMGQNHDREAHYEQHLEQEETDGEDHMDVETEQQPHSETHVRTPGLELEQYFEIPHHLTHQHSLQLRSPSPLPHDHDIVHSPPPLILHESDTTAFSHLSESTSPTTSTPTGPVDSAYPPARTFNPPLALPSPPLVLDYEYNPFPHATSTSTLYNAFHPDLVHQVGYSLFSGPETLPHTPPIGTPQYEMGPLDDNGGSGISSGILGWDGSSVVVVQDKEAELPSAPELESIVLTTTSAPAISPVSSVSTYSTELSLATTSSISTSTSTSTSAFIQPTSSSAPRALPLPTPISELPPVIQDVGIGLGMGPSSATVRAEYEAGADGFQDQTALGRLASMSLMAAITAKGTLSLDVHTTFVSEVGRISHDPIYWVRREAVFALGALAKVVPQELVFNSLLPLIGSFATDEAWQIRHSVLFALPAVLTRLTPQDRRQEALKTIRLLWRDSSSNVREAVLEVLGEVIYAFWEDAEQGGPPEELVKLFLGLDTGWEGEGRGGEMAKNVKQDQDVGMAMGAVVEVGASERRDEQKVLSGADRASISEWDGGEDGDAGKVETMDVDTNLSSSRSERGDLGGPSRALIRAFNFPAIVLTLGRDRWGELREHYLNLTAETQTKVQQTLAASVGEIAKIIGPQHAHADLIDPWYRFASADERIVRLKSYDGLEAFWSALDLEDRRSIAMYLRRTWNSDKLGWLERERLIQVVTRLVEISPEHADVFVSLIGKAFKDSFAAVRKAAVSAYSQVMLISKAGGEDTQKVLRMLHREVTMLAYSSSFRNRATYIACQQELFDRGLHYDVLLDSGFLDMASTLAQDSVVNVRIGISRLLSGFLAELKTSRSIPAKLDEIVEQLALDPIHDVRAFALTTLSSSLGAAAVKESPVHPSTTFSRPPPQTPNACDDAQAAR